MTQAERDLRWMAQALDQARAAQALDEVPVGAVLVREDTDTVLGVGFNRPISGCDPTTHTRSEEHTSELQSH